ncbi:methenyltetrahydromethanopterin cyclohydrolase [Halanaerobium sp. Z-7514]|uniref:Methenyltetrahydromethanopterin cyclohydrolase n=1 Tax=Halanaerobium polyolivorans TaxID=2886943 RepID=A0AAW4WYF0_9FIRM|nr:methenyltetrahydromethanopterin cyclohydrolase [Halanaerobium polyolivorans]MCC3144105.1 methenyltetrahydromethanopterin cyclohydrolase [Halanaerobium polyolivorans]
MGKRLALNKNAVMLVKEMLKKRRKLNIDLHHYDDGITVIDGGINVKGGYEAGAYFSEICLGGMGKVDFCDYEIDSYLIPAVKVQVDHPLEACMLSQYAGWKIEKDDFFAMGSGPGRMLVRKEEIIKEYDSYYESKNAPAVIVLETSQLPDESTAEYIVDEMTTPCSDSYILVAPTESLVGSIQISARIVETGMHKLHELDFDLRKVEAGWGVCPISPTADESLKGIGRTNDAVLYGGTAYYQFYCEDKEIEKILEQIPSSSSEDYGEKFITLFKRYNNFYDIDPMLFSPARVIINNRKSGKVFKAGQINKKILTDSFFQ